MPRVKDFRPASRNANKHTARGMSELQRSVQSNGWIGAMTTAADGEMIAGSARIGNSVPPLFMRSIARHIRTEILSDGRS